MKIDGKAIAEKILEDLTRKVILLKKKGIVPTLAVILIGDNPASLSYIKQKQKTAERIGAKLILRHQTSDIRRQTLQDTIQQYNDDKSIHGIIVQRPLPKESSIDASVLLKVNPQKDVDGFVSHSPFPVPVAKATITILNEIFQLSRHSREDGNPTQKSWIPDRARLAESKRVGDDKKNDGFENWLHQQSIAILGRGETAGKPIADYLARKQCATSTIHSQTPRPQELIRHADIVISCVGKDRVVTKDMIKPKSILISVGIWRDSEGKLHGDYEEEDIKDVASFYTPTPGGVGPINVACLMQNLVEAAKII